MIFPEKLTEEEIQFLRDNKASVAVNLLRKIIRVAYTTYDYELRNSTDHSHGFLAHAQGKKSGIMAVLNIIDFHCQDKIEQPKPKGPTPIR